MKYLKALAAVAAGYSVTAIAQTERDLDSHVHGAASMNVAVADSAVFIELDTPWNNLVGFEHAPSTDEQHSLVDSALQILNDPDQLFTFDGGDCAIDTVMVENTMAEGDSHDEGHEEGHEEGHGKEHDDEHDDHDKEHAEEHSDHDEESESHTTVLVTYSYNCDQIASLNAIDLSLFSIWSGFNDLDVQLIGETGQTLVELNPENTTLKLDQVK